MSSIPEPRRGFALAITDGTGRPFLSVDVRAVLAAGADAVLLREDGLPDGLPEGPQIFVHARIPDAVALARAHRHGLHLPGGADPAGVRAHFRGRLSQSCHSVTEVRAALAAGVDLVLLSPIWSPGSKPGDARPTLGPAVFETLRGLPVLALGGVDASRVAQAAVAGAFGAAAIGAFFGPDADPAAFLSAMRRAYSTDQL